MVGEHIRALKGGRWIHAIDCGDETVLHLAEDVAPPRVRRAYRPEFVAGAQSVEHVTHRERTFPPTEVVRRAYSRASDPTLAAMFRDSEAFAEWCTTGRLSGPRNVALETPRAAAAAPAPTPRNGAPRPQRPSPAVKPGTSRRPPKGARKAAAKKRSARKANGAKQSARARKRPAARTKTAKRPVKRSKRNGARR